jgi:hypothetical protein
MRIHFPTTKPFSEKNLIRILLAALILVAIWGGFSNVRMEALEKENAPLHQKDWCDTVCRSAKQLNNLGEAK